MSDNPWKEYRGLVDQAFDAEAQERMAHNAAERARAKIQDFLEKKAFPDGNERCKHPTLKIKYLVRHDLFWCTSCGAIASGDGAIIEQNENPWPPPGASNFLRPEGRAI